MSFDQLNAILNADGVTNANTQSEVDFGLSLQGQVDNVVNNPAASAVFSAGTDSGLLTPHPGMYQAYGWDLTQGVFK